MHFLLVIILFTPVVSIHVWLPFYCPHCLLIVINSRLFRAIITGTWRISTYSVHTEIIQELFKNSVDVSQTGVTERHNAFTD